MPKTESTIPVEIVALGLPSIERVVLMGGGVYELAGIRNADDIDLVTDLKNRHALLKRNPELWHKITHVYRRSTDGSRLRITSISDTSKRFDIWTHWYDESRPKGSRHISLEELLDNSTQHRLGFYVVNLDFMIDLKRHSSRPKDVNDVALAEAMAKTHRS